MPLFRTRAGCIFFRCVAFGFLAGRTLAIRLALLARTARTPDFDHRHFGCGRFCFRSRRGLSFCRRWRFGLGGRFRIFLDRSGVGLRFRRFSLGGIGGSRFRRDFGRRLLSWLLGRLRAAIHAIAECLQDRCKVVAGAADERGHTDRNRKAEALDRASGLFARRARLPGNRGTDEIGQPLENIHAHGPRAGDAIARRTIERLRYFAIVRDRRASRGSKRGQFAHALLREPAVLQGPQGQRKLARRGLQQRGHIDVIGAEPHAVFA